MEATVVEDMGRRQRVSRRVLPTQRHLQVPPFTLDHRARLPAIHTAARLRNLTQLGLLPRTPTLRLAILHIRPPRFLDTLLTHTPLAPRHTHTLLPDPFLPSHTRQELFPTIQSRPRPDIYLTSLRGA